MTAEIITWLRFVNDFCTLEDQAFCTQYSPQEYHPAGDLHTLLLVKGSRIDAVRFYMAELVRTPSLLPFSLLHRPSSVSSQHLNIFTPNESFTEISSPRMYSLTLMDILSLATLVLRASLGLDKILSQATRCSAHPPIPPRKCSLEGHMGVRLIYGHLG